jgi:hypothetical protein
MLVAQPSKRSGAELFANDLRFDIADGERTFGAVAVDRKRPKMGTHTNFVTSPVI